MMTGLKVCAYGEELEIATTNYRENGALAVLAFDKEGEPYGNISVNLPESADLPEGAFYVKHWSENEPLFAALIEQGIIEPVDAPVAESGFISGIKAYRLRVAE